MRALPARWTVALTAIILAAMPCSASGAPATGPDRELDSALQDLAAADRSGASVAGVAADQLLRVTPGERVLVDVYVSEDVDAAASRLQALGMDVRARAEGPPLGMVEGYLPVAQLRDATAVPGVTALRPVLEAAVDAGAVTSQGVAAHRATPALIPGVTGAGVKVGVISDSINQVTQTVSGEDKTGIAASQASGDLPADVTVLSDHAGRKDEGRAMAEIIYDMAPGITQMAFASGTASGAAGKAAAIASLVTAGAKIIADDIAFLGEPFFQDGVVSQAVDDAKSAGVLYFASAGNRARQSWEGTPTFGAAPSYEDFDPGTGVDTTQTLVTLPAAGAGGPSTLSVTLQWDEPWGAAKHDIDIELVNPSSPGTVYGSATTDNVATGLPVETVSIANSGAGTFPIGVRIKEKNVASGAPALTRLKYVANGNFNAFSVAEFPTASDTINTDAAAAKGSLAVAAVAHNRAGLNVPESFSSRGPKTRLFDKTGARLATPEVRQKPELAAADAVSTTVPGFTSFAGTSAATPSAAGVAALVLSAKPTLSLSLLRAIMTDPRNGNDCAAAGLPDLDCGWGFMFADRAVAQAQDASPPTVTPIFSTPPTADGWWNTDVSITGWTVADPNSPTEQVSGCGTLARTTDGQSTASCQGRSVGGTATGDGVLRRDTVPPAVPVISGIAPGAFSRATLPLAGGVTCASADGLSGLKSCVVTGYDAAPGAHTLTATATDRAGNTRTATVAYTVEADPAPPATAPPVLAAPQSAGEVRGPRAAAPASLVALPSARACVKRTTRLKLKVSPPASGRVTLVRVKITGVRKLVTRTKAGTIMLPKLGRRKVTVKVTVTLADGRTGSVSRTYRRC